MEDTATSLAPAVPRPAPAPGDTARHQAIVRKRIAVVAGLLCVTAAIAALCVRFGPELLAFVGDAPRFRAWVDDAGAMGRVLFVAANMAQAVFAFLPGEPLELGATHSASGRARYGASWPARWEPPWSWCWCAPSACASWGCSSRPRR